MPALTSDPRGLIFASPDAYADPVAWHATAAELRRDAPVLRVEAEGFGPFWALTRHADVFDVSRHNELWHNTRDSVLGPDIQMQVLKMLGIEPATLVHMDGQEHRDHRKVTNDWFKPAAVKLRQSDIDEVADEYVAKLLEMGGSCDFAQDIAVPYTIRVIMSIFGVPPSDEATMLRLTQGLFGAADPEYLGDMTDPFKMITDTIGEFEEYFGHLAAQRRDHPTDDLATVIANGQIDGCPLGQHASLWYFIIVATAGHDTTSFALSGGLEALLAHPEQLSMIAADNSLITNASEEIIRWTAPVRHFLRYAQEDTEINGVQIPEGDRVLLSYWSANRDEAAFENAATFDIQRTDVSNLISFGLGAHYCLGSQFARREIKTFLPKMLERISDIESNGTPEWSTAHFVGGVKHLPITYRVK